MIHISTNATLFLKFAIPIVWMVFFGSFMIGAWLVEATPETGPSMPLRIGLTLFFFVGVAFFYWTCLRLKRIEVDNEFVYVTNYFKTFRYPWHNVEKIEEKDFLFFRTVYFYFKTPGQFGQKVYCVASQKRLNEFIQTYPEVAGQFQDASNS